MLEEIARSSAHLREGSGRRVRPRGRNDLPPGQHPHRGRLRRQGRQAAIPHGPPGGARCGGRAETSVQTPALIAAMERLAAATSETTYLSEWLRGDVVAVSFEGTHLGAGGCCARRRARVRPRTRFGEVAARVRPTGQTRSGAQSRTPAARTTRTITHPEKLKTEVIEAREHRYAIDLGEFIEDVCCVSARWLRSLDMRGTASRCSSPPAGSRSSVEKLIQAVTDAASGVRLSNAPPAPSPM